VCWTTRGIPSQFESPVDKQMIPDITNLQSGGCSSCGGTCNGSGGSACCNHVPDSNGLVTIDFIDVLVAFQCEY
jgi:hypothetical protein